MKELEAAKSKVKDKIERILDSNDLMPDNMKQLKKEIEQIEETKKEFGYAGMGALGMSDLTNKKESFDNFVNIVDELKVKVEILGENSITENFKKMLQLESLSEVLGDKNQISEIKINKATNESNFNLSKIASGCVVMVQEQKDLKEAIEETIKKSNELNPVQEQKRRNSLGMDLKK